MDNPLAVGIGHRLAHTNEALQQVAENQDAGLAVVCLDRLTEGPALNEPHRIIRLPRGVPFQGVNGDDARMLQLGGNLRLVEEAPPRLGAAPVRANLLERDRPIQLAVTAEADLTQPTPGVQSLDGESTRLPRPG